MIECQPCNRSNLSTIDPVAHVGAVVGLWIICFFISAAGIALIYVARKRARAAATAKPGAEGSPPPP
jgi:apolipoprotein N-acyltransferase